MSEYADKTVVITGAAGGIGQAISHAFASAGAHVVLLDQSIEQLEHLAETLQASTDSTRVTTLLTDLTDAASVEAAADNLRQAGQTVHVLVNAAGLLRQGRVVDMSVDDFDAILAVNVRGVFLSCKYFVPLMQQGGAIVNLSSVSAFAGSDGSTVYTLTKGAVSSFSLGLAQELAPSHIRVNALCPGWVDAGFTHQVMAHTEQPEVLEQAARDAHVLGRMAKPEEIAQAALFLASETQASFVTGTNLFVDGGFMVKR
ncbi:MAG: SDR family oxidoreductase [Deinococcota bacterium]